jgi:hypothetical protein
MSHTHLETELFLMTGTKNNYGLIFIFTLGGLTLGFAFGMFFNKGGFAIDKSNNTAAVGINDLSQKNVEELHELLSQFVLPENEFVKLESAIMQAGMGLLMAQSQNQNATITDEVRKNLETAIKEKYNRKYFSDMNSSSMNDLTKDEMVNIIGFYNTDSGKKFLETSPKIIQATMSNVQTDVSTWLPKTVGNLIAKATGKEVKEEQPTLGNSAGSAPAGLDHKANN